jgi:hypothetical protein
VELKEVFTEGMIKTLIPEKTSRVKKQNGNRLSRRTYSLCPGKGCEAGWMMVGWQAW